MNERYLRWKGRQWVFQRCWPQHMVEERGAYLVRNLGTSDLLKARILRDQLVAEMNGEAFEHSQRDAQRLAVYAWEAAQEY